MIKKIKLKSMRVQIVKGSCYVYIPKSWVNSMNLKQGDKVSWYLPEDDHTILELRKEEEE